MRHRRFIKLLYSNLHKCHITARARKTDCDFNLHVSNYHCFCPIVKVEHDLLIKELTTHLYLKSEKSRQKRTRRVAYMTDNAALAAKGTHVYAHTLGSVSNVCSVCTRFCKKAS